VARAPSPASRQPLSRDGNEEGNPPLVGSIGIQKGYSEGDDPLLADSRCSRFFGVVAGASRAEIGRIDFELA
jgi:hypothetical protein